MRHYYINAYFLSQNRAFNFLERDPIFHDDDRDLSLEEQRIVTYRRVKRLQSKDFVDENEVMLDIKKVSFL